MTIIADFIAQVCLLSMIIRTTHFFATKEIAQKVRDILNAELKNEGNCNE